MMIWLEPLPSLEICSISLQYIVKLLTATLPSRDNFPTCSLENSPPGSSSLATTLATNLRKSWGMRSSGSLRCFSQRQLFFLVTTQLTRCQYLLTDIMWIGGMAWEVSSSSFILSSSLKKPTAFSVRMKDASTAKTYTLAWSVEEQTHSVLKKRLSPSDLSFSREESLRRDLTPLTLSAFLEELLVTRSECLSLIGDSSLTFRDCPDCSSILSSSCPSLSNPYNSALNLPDSSEPLACLRVPDSQNLEQRRRCQRYSFASAIKQQISSRSINKNKNVRMEAVEAGSVLVSEKVVGDFQEWMARQKLCKRGQNDHYILRIVLGRHVLSATDCSQLLQFLPPHPPSLLFPFPPPMYLSTQLALAAALHKSVAKYSLTITDQLPSPRQTKTLSPACSLPKRKKTGLVGAVVGEAGGKHLEKNSEIELQKIVSSVTINESKVAADADTHVMTCQNRLIEQAKIPLLGLSAQQLAIKRASLVERQVEGWKMERQRKKSTKISYNWY